MKTADEIIEKLTSLQFKEWMPLIGETNLLKYRKMLMDSVYRKIPIEPSPDKVFRCFERLQPNDVKVVILGQDPYPDGKATGLAFANDVSPDAPELMSPSLKVIRDSVLSLTDSKNLLTFDPTLESWEKQGVLLLNSALTVRAGEPGSHAAAWKPFIERLLVAFSAQSKACFLLFGKQAWSFKSCVFDHNVGVFEEYHPAYYARNAVQMPNTIWKNTINYLKETFDVDLKLYE